jgi:hypothetical protein
MLKAGKTAEVLPAFLCLHFMAGFQWITLFLEMRNGMQATVRQKACLMV